MADHTHCEIRFAKGKDSYINVDDIIELIDKNTAIVCVSYVEYTSGQRFNLRELAEELLNFTIKPSKNQLNPSPHHRTQN